MKFDQSQSSSNTGDHQSLNGTVDQALVNLSSKGNQSQPSVATNETNVEPAAVANNVNLSHSLLACGEKVLLQTAKVTVLAEDGSRIFIGQC